MTGGAYCHASCVVLGEDGVLLRGASGSGKSRLAEALIRTFGRGSGFARLVGDDRIHIVARHGRLVAGGHPRTLGQLELRGLGIVHMPVEPTVCVRLVVDLTQGPVARLPETCDQQTTLAGVVLPLLQLGYGETESGSVALIDAFLSRLRIARGQII